MRHYRCYFMVGDGIKTAEDIGAKDDAGALLKAEELLAASSFASIEVWQEKRLVGRLTATTDPVVIGDGKAPASPPQPGD
jgi:hypothetical protein